MAWFGDGLSSLSNLKGQITSFTKEVLSEGVIEDIDEPTRKLNEANERCVKLQEILNSKDAEISLLRRQNCELEKAVVELNARPGESDDGKSLDDDGGGGYFWDPPTIKNRDLGNKNSERTSILQERLSQATLKIRELENELRISRTSSNELNDEMNDDNRKTEFLRAKQDMVNRIIQIGEKSRDAEKNIKRQSQDETTLINDFRAAISKLDTHEKSHMVQSALRALQNGQFDESQINNEEIEKFDVDEKSEKFVRPRLESVSLLSNFDDSEIRNGITENGNSTSESFREIENLRERIRELQRDNEFLTTSLDELDKEHAQSLDAILVMKDQLVKKHESLQKAYEQLYVECNEAQTKLQMIENKSLSGLEANNNISDNLISSSMKMSNEGKEVGTETRAIERRTITVQTIIPNNEDKKIQTEMHDDKNDAVRSSHNALTERVREILKNSHIEPRENENVFEILATNYVDANWKKEMLERRLTEMSREVKETSEMRDSLQMECDDMQTNIESLLMQIEHLKSNLPSIPEASEERVASLETETESMGEELKQLRSEHEALKSKHFELITVTSIVEGSLRNQENLEAELRNTRQQLSIAQQQLDGASKNVENNENMLEDLSRRLHASLEENNELRKRIENLEISERRANERGAMEKNCTNNDENFEALNNELSTITKQLNDSQNSIKNLEQKLDRAMESRNELERDIAAISSEKDNLESELLILRENASDKETSDLMNNLREQLDTANRDRNDLEYDILNMRKELDNALEELSTRNDEFALLRLERDKIARENDELMEQLRSNNDESTERIELVQTEMNLLAQEHNALKDKTSREKMEISKLREKLMDSESERATLSNDLSNIMSQLETFKSSRKESENQSEIIVSLEKRVESLQVVEEEFRKSMEKCQSLEFELTKLRGLEEEMSREKKEISKLRENLEDSEIKRATLQDDLSATMSQLEILNSDRKESEYQNEKIVTLEKQVESLKFVEEEFRKSEEKCKSLELELRNLRDLEEETKSLRETCKTLETQACEGKTAETRLFEMEKKCNDLETLLENLESEKNEYRVSNDENTRIIGELRENLSNLESLLEKSNDNANMGKETIENLSRLVEEKDREIEIMKNRALTKDENERDEEENALAKLSAEREEFVRLVQEKHNTSLQYYAEIQRLAQLVNEQTTNLERVSAELDKKTSKLGEKDAELLWAQNELKVVRQRLAHLEESQNGETCGIVEHSLQIAQSTILNEKCKALEAALIKEQSSNRIMQNQLTESESRENNAAKELERLRTHLVEMEASYTEEALIAEENRKQLESRLLQAEEKAKNSSTVYTSASIRANQQVETLQQQMSLIVQQRDEIQNKLSLAEDKVLSHTASLTNLQFVLEQFQRDKENDIRAATEKIRQQLNMSYKDQEHLRNEIVNLRIQLSEAKECLQAASRLSEQLDKKSEKIEALNQEVATLTELVNTADQRIQEATSNEEGKVDKNLVKNLLVGFLTSSTMDKSSVLRVFATVLDFNESEREKIGLNNPAANGGWFSGLLGGGGNATTKDQEASLSAAFVRFLESESKPKPQLPALTISNSSLSRPGHSRQHSSSSTQSGLLLSSITLPSFPDFVPSRNTGSILKEVLKDS